MSSGIKERGIQIINDYVSLWTNKYFYQTTYQQEGPHGFTFMTEFSLPLKSKPIPRATVKVYFYLKPDGENINLKFRFENDSLIHSKDGTVRLTQMERWIEKFLDKKSQTSKILFLGTEFEASRIKEPRLDRIFAQMNYRENKVEQFGLDEKLQEIINSEEKESNPFQAEIEIQKMRESLFTYFRAIDEQDLGVVSFQECIQVFKNMGLDLTKEQWKELMQLADKDRNGIIEYKEFVPLGAEIIQAIFAKNLAIKELWIKEQEYIQESIMMMNVDQIHDIRSQIVEKCVKLDEDEENVIQITDLKNILNEHLDVLDPAEIDKAIEIISKDNTTGKFQYRLIYDVLLQIKIDQLKRGLMEGNISKIEEELLRIFSEEDAEKTGFLSVDDCVSALKKSSSIKLSKIQNYIVQSFLPRNEQKLVNYKESSKLLAQNLKKFFSPEYTNRKAELIERGFVEPNEYIDGCSQIELEQKYSNLWKHMDVNGTEHLNLDQLVELCTELKFNFNRDQLEEIIRVDGRSEPDHISEDEFIPHFNQFVREQRCEKAFQKLLQE